MNNEHTVYAEALSPTLWSCMDWFPSGWHREFIIAFTKEEAIQKFLEKTKGL